MPTGDAYSSGHLVPSLWDLHMFYLLRPILFRNLSFFPDYALRISLGTFLILLRLTFQGGENLVEIIVFIALIVLYELIAS